MKLSMRQILFDDCWRQGDWSLLVWPTEPGDHVKVASNLRTPTAEELLRPQGSSTDDATTVQCTLSACAFYHSLGYTVQSLVDSGGTVPRPLVAKRVVPWPMDTAARLHTMRWNYSEVQGAGTVFESTKRFGKAKE